MKIKSMSNNEVNTRYVDIKAVSRYTSLAESTLYEWAGNGRIPSMKVGSRRLFDLKEIDKFMAGLKSPYNQHEKTVNNTVGGANCSEV